MPLRDPGLRKRLFYARLPHPNEGPPAPWPGSNLKKLAQILPNLFGGTTDEWVLKLAEQQREHFSHYLHCYKAVYEHLASRFLTRVLIWNLRSRSPGDMSEGSCAEKSEFTTATYSYDTA